MRDVSVVDRLGGLIAPMRPAIHHVTRGSSKRASDGSPFDSEHRRSPIATFAR